MSYAWRSGDPREVLDNVRCQAIVIHMGDRCALGWVRTYKDWHIEIGTHVVCDEVRPADFWDDNQSWPNHWHWCTAPDRTYG